MAHLIDKDALVAEIDKRLHQLTDAAFDSMIGRNLIEIRDSLDTLEVKEEDENEYINKYFKGWYVDLTDQGNILHTPDGNAGLMSVKEVARHFFELGLRGQNRWKPSENELEVLRLVAEKDGTCLMGLYENLKKLREE